MKTAFQRIEQKNRLFARVCGPLAGTTTEKQKARIVRVLFVNHKGEAK